MIREPEKLRTLKSWVDSANNIAFLGGAGVSTESGIPDFRGKNGLNKQKRDIPMEVLLSADFFAAYPDVFYEQIEEMFNDDSARPNAAHIELARLEEDGKLSAVITQNIDGLHQAAGSKRVLELHGNANRYYCPRCARDYTKEEVYAQDGVPYCECGGVIRPDVVLYGEGLDSDVLLAAIDSIRQADLMIVGGTSLTVYPAAGLIDYFKGDHLVIINESPTPGDARADLVISDPIGEVFAAL